MLFINPLKLKLLMGTAGKRSAQSTQFVRLRVQPPTTEQEPSEEFTIELGQIKQDGGNGGKFKWDRKLKVVLTLGIFHQILDHKHPLFTALSIHRVGDDTHTTLLETIRIGLLAGICTESNGTTETGPLQKPGDGTAWHNNLPVGLPALVLACSTGQQKSKRFEATGPHYLLVDLTREIQTAMSSTTCAKNCRRRSHMSSTST